MMRYPSAVFVAGLLLLAPAITCRAQPADDPVNAETTLSAAALDKLVAPIALYPDPVLTDILAAATYPAEVVEADRFATDPANNGLQGAALQDAAARQIGTPA